MEGHGIVSRSTGKRWHPARRSKISNETLAKQVMHLIEILKRCQALTEASEAALYASTGVVEIRSVLQKAISAIEQGGIPDKKELVILFAPTGDLQETAMANGWAEEYLMLSAKFDDLIT